MEPAPDTVVTVDHNLLEAAIDRERDAQARTKEGFLSSCVAARLIMQMIDAIGFGHNKRVVVEMWGITSPAALTEPQWWEWASKLCAERGLLAGVTWWSHPTLRRLLQIVRFDDEHPGPDGDAVRDAVSQNAALQYIQKYNQQQKAAEQQSAGSSLGKRDRTKKTTTLLEEQAETVAPKRSRRKKAAAGGRGRAAPSRSNDDDADDGGVEEERGGGQDERVVAHRLPRGDYTEPRFAAVMTFIHLLYGRAPAYIDEVTKAYKGAKDEGEEWRFVGAIERALTSEKTGEVRRDLKDQWHQVWRNAKRLHGADGGAGAGAGAAGAGAGASGSSSAGPSVVPSTQLTKLQETELQEAIDALAAQVKGQMTGKGRQGDWWAMALDVIKAATKTFTDLEREQTQMPSPPSRSSTPVVPMSPPATSAHARAPAAASSSSTVPTQSPTPRRSARHTPATSAGASSSSVPMSAPRRSPRLASPQSAVSSTEVEQEANGEEHKGPTVGEIVDATPIREALEYVTHSRDVFMSLNHDCRLALEKVCEIPFRQEDQVRSEKEKGRIRQVREWREENRQMRYFDDEDSAVEIIDPVCRIAADGKVLQARDILLQSPHQWLEEFQGTILPWWRVTVSQLESSWWADVDRLTGERAAAHVSDRITQNDKVDVDGDDFNICKAVIYTYHLYHLLSKVDEMLGREFSFW